MRFRKRINRIIEIEYHDNVYKLNFELLNEDIRLLKKEIFALKYKPKFDHGDRVRIYSKDEWIGMRYEIGTGTIIGLAGNNESQFLYFVKSDNGDITSNIEEYRFEKIESEK